MKYWIQNNGHILILGDIGAGKSTLLNQIFQTSRRKLVVLIDELKIFEGESIASNLNEFRRLLLQEKNRIVFRPNWNQDEAEKEIHKLVEWLFDIGRKTNKEILLLCDEVHNYAKIHKNNSPMVKAIKEGRNRNIKVVSCTQEPQQLHSSVLQQASGGIVYLGTVNQYAFDYLKTKNFPIDKIKEQEQYDGMVLNKKMEVVDRFETNPRYSPD